MTRRAYWDPAAWALLYALAAQVNCAGWPLGSGDCAAALRPVAELGSDRTLRAQARIEHPNDSQPEAHLDLIVEKRGDELALVARNELGVVAFALLQRDARVEIQRSLPRALLPMPPQHLLADVQALLLAENGAGATSRSGCGYTVHMRVAAETP